MDDLTDEERTKALQELNDLLSNQVRARGATTLGMGSYLLSGAILFWTGNQVHCWCAGDRVLVRRPHRIPLREHPRKRSACDLITRAA